MSVSVGVCVRRPGARIGALELNHEAESDAYTTDMRGLGEPSGGLRGIGIGELQDIV